MTSSVLDGAGCESPAPPAFSPLTDPAPDFTPKPHHHEPAVPVHDNMTLDDASAAAANGAPSENIAENSKSNGNSQTVVSPSQHTPTKSEQTTNALGDAMDLDTTMGAAMEFSTNPGFDLYSQHPSQLLMALARLSAASQPRNMMPLPPSTVRPSQVSLPHAMLDTSDALTPAGPNGANNTPPADAPLESFARIEFADSVFQMTTYAVIIGRDQRALDQARRDERRLEEYQRKVRENEQLGLPAPSPPTRDRGKFSKSYVSEEGGMLGPESDGDENPRPSKRRKTSGGAGSASGDSHQLEVAAGEQVGQEEKNPTLNRQYVSHTPGAAAVNLSALRPSPYYVPFIGIHSPGPNIASRTKAISREHLKIQFNQKEGVFEAIPLHKNGFFCEDVHYRDEKVVLRSGDRLQIKDVDFVFIINGVPRGKTGAEEGIDGDGVPSRRYSEGGKEMSFDFESTHNPERRSTSPEENAVEAAKEDSDSELSEPAEDIPEPEPEETPEQEVMETIEKDPEVAARPIKPEIPPELLDLIGGLPQRKRGPGRPPKNGFMSKREERLLRKAAIELEKKNMPQPPPGDPPVKRKVGRPRKHPLPEDAPDRPEKRKYKPRKPKNGEEGEGSDGERAVKERRREKPKTPPLELNREDYTEEQLQKPLKNYGMLIDEVLSAAPDGLTLKQIYKRIQMKYPFFYFSVDTKGWESSVRHNLIGNDAFKKNEETHLWRRVPGIDIDAGKKRKAASPDRSPSLHTFGQPYSASSSSATRIIQAEGPQQGYRPGSVSQRPGYPPGHGAPGQHPQAQPGAQPGAQPVAASTPQAPRQAGAAPTAGYGDPAAARMPQGITQATAYSSPYARPPPATTVQPGGPPRGPAGQGVPHNMPSPVHGVPAVSGSSAAAAAATTPGCVGARPAQTAVNGNALALKPAVAPELVKHVANFKTTVTKELSKRTPAAEAIAMSVINRGLGLATESTVPEEETLEKVVFNVFKSSREKLGANDSLHPGLLEALVKFKNSMIETLEPRMGKLNAERLILSAVDRELGFADGSTIPGSESDRKQYEEAETVLMKAIKGVIIGHQKALAAAASISAPQPASRPGPAVPAQTVPGSVPIGAFESRGNLRTASAGFYVSCDVGADAAATKPQAPTQGSAPATSQAPSQPPNLTPHLAKSPDQISAPISVPGTVATPASFQGPGQLPEIAPIPAKGPEHSSPPIPAPGNAPSPTASQPQSAPSASLSSQVPAQNAAQNVPVKPHAPIPATSQEKASLSTPASSQAPVQTSAQATVPATAATITKSDLSQKQTANSVSPTPQAAAQMPAQPASASAPGFAQATSQAQNPSIAPIVSEAPTPVAPVADMAAVSTTAPATAASASPGPSPSPAKATVAQ
ncbi:hypothetical protein C8A03DRAFT_35668 [Achaetomium macrosporum]|uniref:Fork-head domain-containing protein n=1 Tax=Achaetomium macrosporum TaxID=79813 RepID=A0AAN7C8P3_9PEZI|nr:hypothetical protein C8A03DRAFT_35668 [Achaetomium macrosporum]